MQPKHDTRSLSPAAPPALPALDAATLLRALSKRPGRAPGLPAPRTRYLLDRIDTAQLGRYRAAFGFAGDDLPLSFWYLPAQRAQLATMLTAAFPFRLPGAIHADNLLRLHAAPDPDAALLLSTSVTIQPPTDHGAVFAVLDTTGEQHGQALFDCRSTYLMVRGRARAGSSRPHETPLSTLAEWEVGPACGRRYAALSGDWNPIHLWSWSARLMGLRQPIIHGMHSLARACAGLERLHGRPVTLLDAHFRAPVPLASRLALGADPASGLFTVARDGRVAVSGRYALAPGAEWTAWAL